MPTNYDSLEVLLQSVSFNKEIFKKNICEKYRRKFKGPIFIENFC